MLLSIVIAAATSYWAVQSMPRSYQTHLTLMVGEDSTNPNLTADKFGISQRLADSYAGIARREPILSATVDALRLADSWRELQSRVLVTRVAGTQLIEIRVVDTNPERVRATAEEIGRQLIQQSPTQELTRQLEARQQFVREQLDALQANIRQAETDIAGKQEQLKTETSARAVLDRQGEIQALMLNLNGWRATYASFLSTSETRSPNMLTVLEPAYLPTEPIGPDVRAAVLMAALVGMLMSLGAAFLIEYLTNTLNSAEDIRRNLSVDMLGSIADMGSGGSYDGKLISSLPYGNPISEAFSMLCANLEFAYGDQRPLVLMVTSPGSREGKSVTSANLALSFARSHKRTLLVEADLRRPTLHTLFKVSNEVGLSSLFLDPSFGIRKRGEEVAVPAGRRRGKNTGIEEQGVAGGLETAAGTDSLRRRLESCIITTEVSDLRFLPAGPPPANPAGLVNSPGMHSLLALFRESADVVILDTPPVLAVADTAILASRVGAVLLVVERGRTRTPHASQAVATLSRAGAQLLGVALNRMPRRATRYYYHYYSSLEQSKAATNGLGTSQSLAASTAKGWFTNIPSGISALASGVGSATSALAARSRAAVLALLKGWSVG